MDAALVRAAREGSQAAFARLVALHGPALRGFLRRAHGWTEADDIAQETFVAAWSGLDRLRDDAGFRPWLFGIAWRKAQTAGRSAVRAARRDGDWVAEPAAEAMGAEDRMALEAALAELPPDQRAAVTLCLGEGWTHAEAAQALRLPLGTVKSHVTRGRDRLLARLGESA
ncbi:MAG TPA: RNA polymerase sigma factor [Caulobacter sp.]|nr:RNA polymerase sigma factor [Caulobacter sp.]